MTVVKDIPGIEVTNLTHVRPGSTLPSWVHEAASSRGYGDSTVPLSLYVQDHDIDEAFRCAAQGNGAACVMAQAGKRIGAKSVYFYRTTAWIDFGIGPIVRFRTSKQIYSNVIEPFDRGERDEIRPGIYHLVPPSDSQTLVSGRAYNRAKQVRKPPKRRNAPIITHTERVVMATQKGSHD